MALAKAKELASSNPVFIFSNKFCPYCVCVKQLFVLKLGVQYKAIELDQESKCLICSLDEHTSSVCPYQVEVPKNATVNSGCDVVCRVCDREFSGRCCNQDSGRAKLKFCDFCMQFGQHWTFQCPHKHEHTSVPVRFGPRGWLTSSAFKCSYIYKFEEKKCCVIWSMLVF